MVDKNLSRGCSLKSSNFRLYQCLSTNVEKTILHCNRQIPLKARHENQHFRSRWGQKQFYSMKHCKSFEFITRLSTLSIFLGTPQSSRRQYFFAITWWHNNRTTPQSENEFHLFSIKQTGEWIFLNLWFSYLYLHLTPSSSSSGNSWMESSRFENHVQIYGWKNNIIREETNFHR